MLQRLFLQLQVFPVLLHLFRILGPRLAEHVRMAENQLVADRIGHVAYVESLLLGAHFGIEDDMQQQIAQLLFHIIQIMVQNRVGQFVGFLYRIHSERLERLLAVPRALDPQLVHHVEQSLQGN